MQKIKKGVKKEHRRKKKDYKRESLTPPFYHLLATPQTQITSLLIGLFNQS
jgi:hypothetical protein